MVFDMKNTTLFLALFLGMAVSTCTLASAYDPQIQSYTNEQRKITELNKTAVQLLVSKPGSPHNWQRFVWWINEPGSNDVALWPQTTFPWLLPLDITVDKEYTITVRDENYKVLSTRTFESGTSLKEFALYLAETTLRLGKDSIQFTSPDSSDYHFRVEGKVENLGRINFYQPTTWQTDNYAFFPSVKGLRASYAHQERVDDFSYLIGNHLSGNKVLMTDLYQSLNVFVGEDSAYPDKSTWRVTYDGEKLAYRIEKPTMTEPVSLAWTPKYGHNVFVYEKLEESADQYWFFKLLETTHEYEIVSAYDITKHLNVDVDQRNVSVANETQRDNQKFYLEKLYP